MSNILNSKNNSEDNNTFKFNDLDEGIRITISNNHKKQSIDLQNFNYNSCIKINPNTLGTFLILGHKGTGKTTLIKDIMSNLYSYQVIKNTVIFDFNKTQYSDIVDNINKIENKFNSFHAKNIIKMQKYSNSEPLLIVLENFHCNEDNFDTSKYFYDLFKKRNNLKLTIIISSQTIPFPNFNIFLNHIDFTFAFSKSSQAFYQNINHFYPYKLPILDLLFNFPEHRSLVNVKKRHIDGNNITSELQSYNVTNFNFNLKHKIKILNIADIYKHYESVLYSNNFKNDQYITQNNIFKTITENNKQIKILQERNEFLIKKLESYFYDSD